MSVTEPPHSPSEPPHSPSEPPAAAKPVLPLAMVDYHPVDREEASRLDPFGYRPPEDCVERPETD